MDRRREQRRQTLARSSSTDDHGVSAGGNDAGQPLSARHEPMPANVSARELATCRTSTFPSLRCSIPKGARLPDRNGRVSETVPTLVGGMPGAWPFESSVVMLLDADGT